MSIWRLLLLVSFLELVRGQASPCTSAGISKHTNIHLINNRWEHVDTTTDGRCGRVFSSRFVMVRGGTAVRNNSTPWMVRIYNNRPQGVSGCGGTLINRRYVLTAAHCTYPMNANALSVFVPEGDYNVESCPFDISPARACAGKYHAVMTVINHYQYSPVTDHHDIALLRLTNRLTFGTRTNAICLDTSCTAQSPGFEVGAAGWGYTHGDPDYPSSIARARRLKSTQLFIRSCPPTYDSKDSEGLTSDNPFLVGSIPQQVCAAGIGGSIRGTCSGDSGGPLYYRHHGGSGARYYQYGITSFGPPCVGHNQNDIPQHFTNIRFYLNWILDNMSAED